MNRFLSVNPLLPLLLVAAASLFFFKLGSLPLLEPDEGRNAEVAREMSSAGDWVTPHYNGLPYLDKPVVFFWMVALSFRAFGTSEWAARLPSAFLASATTFLCWLLARRMLNGSAAFRAAFALVTCPLVIAFSRLVIFDMTLTFLVTLALVCFWFGEELNQWRTICSLLLFAAMGLAAITKGPVGFILPLLSILIYLALSGRLREIRRLQWGWGGLTFLAVALPWFVAVSLANPGFPRYAFWQESLQRFATGHAHRSGSILYYVPVFVCGLFPWSVFLVFVTWTRAKRWRQLKEQQDRFLLFLLSWAAVVFVFFSISRSKLPGYFLPACVPLSILMAAAWEEVLASPEDVPSWITAGFATLILFGLLLAGAPKLLDIATLHQHITQKLHSGVLALLKPSLVYSGVLLMALGVMGRNLAGRRRAHTGLTFIVVALTVPLLLVRWIVPLQRYFDAESSRQTAHTILASAERDLPVYSFYCFRTALPFYLRRPVGLITTDGDEMTSNYIVTRFPQLRDVQLDHGTPVGCARQAGVDRVPHVLESISDVQSMLRASKMPMLVLARNQRVEEVLHYFAGGEPLWTEWRYTVLRLPSSAH